MFKSQQPTKSVNLMTERPVLKQYHRNPPVVKNWSIYSRRTCRNAPQWIIMPICTTFSTFAFLALVICSSATNRWVVLKSADHAWEQHVGIWHDCLSKNCSTDITSWPTLQTAQGFMITAVLCSFLLTTWLFGFFCTSLSLKMHCHLIFIILSFLTGTCLFIAIMLLVFLLEKVNGVQNTYYVVLWPFYMLWIAFILLLTCCILGIISYKGPDQKSKNIISLMNTEPRQRNYSRTSVNRQSFTLTSLSEKKSPGMLQFNRPALGSNWTTDREVYDVFRDVEKRDIKTTSEHSILPIKMCATMPECNSIMCEHTCQVTGLSK
ncbi:uncharacterized protein LOC118830821 [Trichosurus vulpecula]|uniref:uncharacterized protein LOC118830821 n=1 Tax=Trichosurus vulpecula TaxID=9337 RepID=UPI00186B0685|nr:uncharacterized protein LOC118830821 [Trichosurus vulpecula]